MVRLLYTTLFTIFLPLVLLRLWWRGRLAPAYRQRWGERLGLITVRQDGSPLIWVHAVSVGETLAALPMIEQLLQRYPAHQLLVTTTTPTGSERVKAALGDRVLHCYAPYDLPFCLHLFLQRMRPDLLIVMETELWPNTLRACHHNQIPVVVANARLSEKSARGYVRFSRTTQDMLSQVSVIAAQHQSDGDRFLQLGLKPGQLSVTGSIKFDLSINDQVKNKAAQIRNGWLRGQSRFVWLAASTHEGEDEPLLQAHRQLLQAFPDLLLVLVPRHPERFDRVASLAEGEGFTIQRRSQGADLDRDVQVLIGDTMGELLALIGATDLVFMGGSWVDNGGHNLIEPAAWGKPQLSGPSLFNFAEVSRLLLEVDALTVVETPAQCADTIKSLLQQPDIMARQGAAAQAVADGNRGALERLLAQIDRFL
jgi:3-deoxy-D-manno-octulosonic-acid transferase